MATTTYLPEDFMEEEILPRVPLTSLRAVRSTCKTWNALSRNQIFGKPGAGKQLTGFMVMDSKLCSMEFDLERFQKEGDFPEPCIKQASIFNLAAKSKVPDWEWDGHWNGDCVDPSITQSSLLNEAEICQVFQWDGLVLCVIKDKRWCVVWNPYLGEVRWIQPLNNSSHKFDPSDMYALGYDDDSNSNRNHKILRLLDVYSKYSSRLRPFYEMYDFYSDSWKKLDVDPGCHLVSGVPLKGNTYFLAQETLNDARFFLLCFDFTAERFGPRLALPFGSCVRSSKDVILSCVMDEKLAVLDFCEDHMMEIWITSKIGINAASWSRFLRVELTQTCFVAESFFIDEEKKVAVVSELRKSSPTNQRTYQRAYVFGVDGYFKAVNIGKARKPGSQYYNQLVFSSYAPSLVKVVQPKRLGKRKVM